MMRTLSNEQRGALYVVCSGLLYGLIGYFGITIIHQDISVTNMLFWRFLISGAFISLLLFPVIRRIKIDRLELIKVICYGASFYSISSILYFIASQHIGTGLAMVLFFTYPTLVIFINKVFYKQNLGKIYYLAIGLISVGMILLVDISEFTFDVLGVLLGVLAAGFYACYIIFSKKCNLPPRLSSLMVSMGCASTCFILASMNQSFLVPQDLSVWGNILGIGIICTALPILLLLKGMKYISAEKASILSVLEPVFVVIFGVILLGERLNNYQTIGVVIILMGAMVTLFSRKILNSRAFLKR